MAFKKCTFKALIWIYKTTKVSKQQLNLAGLGIMNVGITKGFMKRNYVGLRLHYISEINFNFHNSFKVGHFKSLHFHSFYPGVAMEKKACDSWTTSTLLPGSVLVHLLTRQPCYRILPWKMMSFIGYKTFLLQRFALPAARIMKQQGESEKCVVIWQQLTSQATCKIMMLVFS